MSAVLNAIARFLFFNIIKIFYTYGLTNSSIWIGILIGFGIPLISNILPIR